MIRLPNRKQNPLLWTVILFSILIHAVGLMIFGGLTVWSYVMEDDTTFVPPEQIRSIDPQKLNFQASLRKQQQQSSRPKNRIEVKSVANIELQSIDIDLPTISTSANLGGNANIGGGLQTGGLSLSAVSVNILGVEGRGEKFLFILDVSGNAMRDSKGGIPAFAILQNELIRVVRGLPRGVLFNIIFKDGTKFHAWKPQLVPATDQNLSEFENAVRARNTSADNYGVRDANIYPAFTPEPLGPSEGNNHFGYFNDGHLAITAALEMTPDTVFYLSSIVHNYNITALTDDYESRLKMYEQRFKDMGYKTSEEAQKARREIFNEANKIANQREAAMQAERKKKGIPPKVWGKGERHNFVFSIANEVAKEQGRRVPPQMPWQNELQTERVTGAYWEQVLRQNYDVSKAKHPILNFIFFKGEDEAFNDEMEDHLDNWIRQFKRGMVKGEHRVLEGLKDIQKAAGL